jgi:hypothetical protein
MGMGQGYYQGQLGAQMQQAQSYGGGGGGVSVYPQPPSIASMAYSYMQHIYQNICTALSHNHFAGKYKVDLEDISMRSDGGIIIRFAADDWPITSSDLEFLVTELNNAGFIIPSIVVMWGSTVSAVWANGGIMQSVNERQPQKTDNPLVDFFLEELDKMEGEVATA